MRWRPKRWPVQLERNRINAVLQPQNQVCSSLPRRALEDAFDRSDRQLANSVNRTWRQSHPTTSREWSPAERFVSGSAPAGATRPFVDVQSALCRYAALRVARPWMGWEVPIDRKFNSAL